MEGKSGREGRKSRDNSETEDKGVGLVCTDGGLVVLSLAVASAAVVVRRREMEMRRLRSSTAAFRGRRPGTTGESRQRRCHRQRISTAASPY